VTEGAIVRSYEMKGSSSTSRRSVALAAAAVALGLLATVPVRADIVSVSGNGDIINPASGGALPNFFNDTGPNPKIHGWDEA
jgi:hypothetical protein